MVSQHIPYWFTYIHTYVVYNLRCSPGEAVIHLLFISHPAEPTNVCATATATATATTTEIKSCKWPMKLYTNWAINKMYTMCIYIFDTYIYTSMYVVVAITYANPLEFAFLWHVTRLFVGRIARRAMCGGKPNKNCKNTYLYTERKRPY